MTIKPTSQFTVRPAQSADIPHCLSLITSLETQMVWQMHRREADEAIQVGFQPLRLPRPTRVDYPRNPAELEADLNPLKGVLVAEAQQVILGYIQTSIVSADKNAWVRNLVVDEAWRRRHIGWALLEQAKGWARLQGANHMMTETTTRSYPAIRFMLNQGFLFCGFNDRYYASQAIAVFFGQNL